MPCAKGRSWSSSRSLDGGARGQWNQHHPHSLGAFFLAQLSWIAARLLGREPICRDAAHRRLLNASTRISSQDLERWPPLSGLTAPTIRHRTLAIAMQWRCADIGCADAHIVLSLSNAVPADLPSPLSSVKSRRAVRHRQSDKGESSEYCTPLSGSVSASRRAMKNCCADGVDAAHRI